MKDNKFDIYNSAPGLLNNVWYHDITFFEEDIDITLHHLISNKFRLVIQNVHYDDEDCSEEEVEADLSNEEANRLIIRYDIKFD